MFGFNISSACKAKPVLDALWRSLAIIEFDLTGKILSANPNFCSTLGYTLSEIMGQHHNMFVEPEYASSPEYKAFWAKLGRGEFDADEYKRIGKGGREVWIEASYNPVLNSKGVVFKFVTVATDITDRIRAMKEISVSLEPLAGKINGEVMEIARVARQRGTELAKLNTALNRMDQMTQQNEAMLKETLAASHSLLQVTTQLARVVNELHASKANDNAQRINQKAALHLVRLTSVGLDIDSPGAR